MIHQVLRHDFGIVPERVAGAVIQAIAEAVVSGVRFPCLPIIAECYPEGAVLHGSCKHTTFLKVLLVPDYVPDHDDALSRRWGSRQTVPIRAKEFEGN